MRYITPAELIAIHELLLTDFGGMRGITEAGRCVSGPLVSLVIDSNYYRDAFLPAYL